MVNVLLGDGKYLVTSPEKTRPDIMYHSLTPSGTGGLPSSRVGRSFAVLSGRGDAKMVTPEFALSKSSWVPRRETQGGKVAWNCHQWDGQKAWSPKWTVGQTSQHTRHLLLSPR